MKENLKKFLKTLIQTLFPERKQERLVSHMTLEDLEILPRPDTSLPGITSLFSYKDTRVQALIWELKYHRNPHVITLVAKILSDVILEDLMEKQLFEYSGQVLLIPIPSSSGRLQERKFSQTNLLCKEMIHNLSGTTFAPDGLKKILETEKQSWAKSKGERLKNLADCFIADQSIVEGSTVILIDDVTTTGATIDEATKALLAAHAKKILAFTVAH